MTQTYTWIDAEQTQLRRDDGPNNFTCFFAVDDCPEYREFLASGATAADYVAPPEPAPLTTEEKLNAAGLTVEELRTLFGLPEPLPADEPPAE
jgi:hypothetical protein